MSGDSDDYSPADEAGLYAALDQAWDYYSGGGTATGSPTRMRVSAQVEWNQVIDRGRNGHRTVNLGPMDMGPVRDALTAARAVHAHAETAGNSFRAKGWQAQVHTLLDHRWGQIAADRAGLSVTPKTLMAWLSGDRAPNAANQQRIAEAYRYIPERLASEARQEAADARHGLADQVTRAIRETGHGGDVRLRHITQMDLS